MVNIIKKKFTNVINSIVNLFSFLLEAKKVYFALDNKKLVENEVCTKKTFSLLSYNIMEIIKHNFAMTQALFQCLEKIMQEKTNVYSVTSHLSKIDVNSNCK